MKTRRHEQTARLNDVANGVVPETDSVVRHAKKTRDIEYGGACAVVVFAGASYVIARFFHNR